MPGEDDLVPLGRLLSEMRLGLDRTPAWKPSLQPTPKWLAQTIDFNERLMAKARMRYAIEPTKENLAWGKDLRAFIEELKRGD